MTSYLLASAGEGTGFTNLQFAVGSVFVSLFLSLFKAPVYYAFIYAYRYRGMTWAPLSVPWALGLTVLRLVLGYLILGGSILFAARVEQLPPALQGSVWLLVLGVVWVYGARFASWYLIGAWGLRLRAWDLLWFSVAGVLVNLVCDGLAALAVYVWGGYRIEVGVSLILLYVLGIALSVVLAHRAVRAW